MSTPRDPPGLLDRLKATVKPPGSPTYTQAQILTTAIWVLSIGGLVLTSWFKLTGEVRIDGLFSVRLDRLMLALLVLWGTLIAQLRRGPLQPLLLINQHREWFALYVVKLPADYARLGQPVPLSAVAYWWFVHLFLAIMAVVLTYIFLTGGPPG